MNEPTRKASDLRKILELISAMNRVYELRDQTAPTDLMQHLKRSEDQQKLH
ncbi:hypothetical protein [Litoribrevibacter albus]|uniref:hypothetical protein n=1 Tax=Litoribrevibacter albus TaxID=1473156 RepID=UPI0024E0C8A2|nr:hypothetical protein [Litoribrevibacter albus]